MKRISPGVLTLREFLDLRGSAYSMAVYDGRIGLHVLSDDPLLFDLADYTVRKVFGETVFLVSR